MLLSNSKIKKTANKDTSRCREFLSTIIEYMLTFLRVSQNYQTPGEIPPMQNEGNMEAVLVVLIIFSENDIIEMKKTDMMIDIVWCLRKGIEDSKTKLANPDTDQGADLLNVIDIETAIRGETVRETGGRGIVTTIDDMTEDVETVPIVFKATVCAIDQPWIARFKYIFHISIAQVSSAPCFNGSQHYIYCCIH